MLEGFRLNDLPLILFSLTTPDIMFISTDAKFLLLMLKKEIDKNVTFHSVLFCLFAANRSMQQCFLMEKGNNEITPVIPFIAAGILGCPLQRLQRTFLFFHSAFFLHFTLSLSLTSSACNEHQRKSRHIMYFRWACSCMSACTIFMSVNSHLHKTHKKTISQSVQTVTLTHS